MHCQIWQGKRRGRRGIQMHGEEFPCYFRKKKQTHRQTKTSRQQKVTVLGSTLSSIFLDNFLSSTSKSSVCCRWLTLSVVLQYISNANTFNRLKRFKKVETAPCEQSSVQSSLILGTSKKTLYAAG